MGVGSFGVVVLAKFLRDKSQLRNVNEYMVGTLLSPLKESEANKSPLVAIKIINKKIIKASSNKELKFILSIPAHPSLVQIYEIFVDPVNFRTHIVMESLNQTLLQLMTARDGVRFTSKTLKSILSQVLDGIKHIHKHDYFHRDIKPENILVIPSIQYFGDKHLIPPHRQNDNYIVKLADYGLGRSVNNLDPYTAYISTRWYRSPEILLRRKWYSKPADIWAFALVAAELVNFYPLFPGTTELDQLTKILRVLGCPVLPDINVIPPNSNYFVPLGGFWREAKMLASKLGLFFPYEQGADMDQILYYNTDKELVDVIKACLTWDPDIRPDVKYVSSMNFFKNTQVYETYLPIPARQKVSSYTTKYSDNQLKLKQLKLASGYANQEFEEAYFNEGLDMTTNPFDFDENIYPSDPPPESPYTQNFGSEALDSWDYGLSWNHRALQDYQHLDSFQFGDSYHLYSDHQDHDSTPPQEAQPLNQLPLTTLFASKWFNKVRV